MAWVEVIRLRIPLQERTQPLKELDALLENCGRPTEQSPKIKAFLGLKPACDIALVISWPGERPGDQPSPLSANISAHLKKYGLVNNSAWIESQPTHCSQTEKKETEDEDPVSQP